MITAETLAQLKNADKDDIRRYVRQTLESAASYRQMAAPDRARLAKDLVTVLCYLTDPTAGQPELAPVAKAQARAQALPLPAGGPRATRAREAPAARAQAAAGGRQPFGPAAQTAPDVFKRLVDTVDFPRFVASLIEGVYTSIVNSSIKQMEAYSKLLEGVVKSVNEFAKDHITPTAARGYLQAQFPRAIRIQDGRLAMNEDLDDTDRPDLKKFLELNEDLALDDEEQEQRIMEAAQLKMARQRQQQLATMVVMGINRIVVTEGEIKASVIFDVQAEDKAKTRSESGTDFSATSEARSESESSGGGWFSDDWSSRSSTVNTTVSTAHTRMEGETDDRIKTKANLSGSVLVRFKSETFPLERLASSDEIAAAQERSKR